jgi:glycosyltransferase involved in cell wall biosynthesis
MLIARDLFVSTCGPSHGARARVARRRSADLEELRIAANIQERATAQFGVRTPGSGVPALRIAFVLAEYLPVIGGTQIHTQEVAQRLAEAGHDVTVLAATRSPEPPASEEIKGVKVLRVPALPRSRDYYFAPEIYRTLRRLKPDIVHCQGYHTFVAPLAMLAAARMKTPYLVTFHSGGHSSWLRRRLRRLQWWMLRPLLTRSECVIAVSRFEEELIRSTLKLQPKLLTVIRNGADIVGADAVEVEVDPDLIVSIGRVERFKGHHKVVQALPHVLAERPKARLRVIGSGGFESQLRGLSGRLGLDDHVEIRSVPLNERIELVRVLLSAALVISLSDYEAYGIGAREALTLGRPLIVSDATAYRELVAGGLARGVRHDESAAGVARAILEQLEHPSSAPPVEFPTWDDCASRLLAIYRFVLADREADRTRGQLGR